MQTCDFIQKNKEYSEKLQNLQNLSPEIIKEMDKKFIRLGKFDNIMNEKEEDISFLFSKEILSLFKTEEIEQNSDKNCNSFDDLKKDLEESCSEFERNRKKLEYLFENFFELMAENIEIIPFKNEKNNI